MQQGTLDALHQPLISANYVLALLDYLREKESIDSQQFLDVVCPEGVPPIEEDTMFPMSTFLILMEGAAAYTGDPDLGMHYYEDFDFRKLGVFGYAGLNAANLKEALDLSCRYYCLFQTDMELHLALEGDTAALSYKVTARNLPYSRQDSEMTISALVQSLRTYLGPGWQPDQVSFQHEKPADVSEHKRLLCSNLVFNQPVNKICFPTALLSKSISGADVNLSKSVISTLDQLLKLSNLPSGSDWLKDLQDLIIASLPDGVPAIEHIAMGMNMSGRTLQRKLLREELSFKDLVEGVRHELAINYLGASDLSTQEIAFLLGYSELSSFGRAFKRWTGQSPAEYRKNRRITPTEGSSSQR